MDKKKIFWWWLSGSFDSSYQAVLDRGTALGYTLPSAAQQIKQNSLVLALKSAGVWNGLDIFYVFATDGNRDFAKINWKSPTTFLITEANTPTFTSNVGFTGNGTNMLLDTNYNARTSGTNYTQDEAGMYGYFTGTFDGMLAGALVTNPIAFRPSSTVYYINSSTGTNTGVAYANGFWHIKRVLTNTAIYKNGAQTATATNASAIRDNVTIQVLRANPSQYSNVTCGVFGVGASQSGLEAAFYTAVNNYIASL